MSRTVRAAIAAFVLILAAAGILLLRGTGPRAAPARTAALQPVTPAAPVPETAVTPVGAPGPAPAAGGAEPGYARGAERAPVVVVEFSDFGCPYCGKFALETYPALHREFVASGKVRWIYVPFVMGMFPNGAEAALASECAADQDEEKFWAMHDALFAAQRAWKSERNPSAVFSGLAREAGLDVAAFESCYAQARPRARIAASNALADESGVRATPTFFVQGQRVQGALPLETFRALLTEVVETVSGSE